VGITGSRLCLRFLKYLAPALLGVLIVTSTPASAHVLNNVHKERRHIKHRAKRELGVPYSYGGTSPSGFDCSGFTRWTFLTHGADLPHSAARQFDLRHQRGYKRVWHRSHLKKGDLVFFSTDGVRIGHVGIFVGHHRFISATSSSGIHIDSVYDPYYWGHRYVAGVRVPGTRKNSTVTTSLSSRTLQLTEAPTGSEDT
jgi:cell wall-associated NlpC family hydrolase